MVREALEHFNLTKVDLKDPSQFNPQKIRALFKQFALICHTDRPTGNLEMWHQLQYDYGVLMGLFENKENASVQRTVQRALALTYNKN